MQRRSQTKEQIKEERRDVNGSGTDVSARPAVRAGESAHIDECRAGRLSALFVNTTFTVVPVADVVSAACCTHVAQLN